MTRKIISIILIAVTLFTILVLPAAAAEVSEPAVEDTRASFEAQSVSKDLEYILDPEEKQAYIDGAGTTFTEVQLLHTMEYGYNSKDMSDYGFYIYIYDPLFGEALTSIEAEMCLLESTGSAYREYDCTLLSKDGYFSKHRVNFGTTVSLLDKDKRVYKISGVTTYNDKGIFKDNNIGLEYSYTGNMKGYGSEVDTLTSMIFDQETIVLETDFTYYRTAGSSKGLYWQNQINTVYFTVPNIFIDEYGKLSAIHHKYKEYETGPMVVTDAPAFGDYAEFLYEVNEDAIYDVGNYAVSDFAQIDALIGISLDYTGTFGFNYSEVIEKHLFTKTYDSPFINETYGVAKLADFKKLPFWFYDPDLASRENNEVAVTADQIYEFLNNHPNVYKGTFFELGEEAVKKYPYPVTGGYWINGVYYEPTVKPDVMVDMTRQHYISSKYACAFGELLESYNGTMDFRDTSNIKTLLSYDVSHSTYDKIQDFGLLSYILGNAYVKDDETISNIHPLAVIEDVDVSLSDADFARKYLVNAGDVTAIKKAHRDAVANDSTLFLFRFDISDYFAKEQTLYYYDTEWVDEWKDTGAAAMVCMQSYYKDFDIISLTFDKNGVETIIPVVHTPEDFVGDITTPSEVAPPINWSALISLILGMVILFIIRKPIGAFVGGIVSGAVKATKASVKGIKRLFKKKE